MKETIRLRAKTAFVLPGGKKVKAGTEFEISLGQAKYLLNNGKAERISAPPQEVEAVETTAEIAETTAEIAETGAETAEAEAEIAETAGTEAAETEAADKADKPKAKGARK